jgi:hypothetical protein
VALQRSSGTSWPSNLARVTYASADARQQLLDTIAEATDRLGVALAALSELYERLDESSAETVEETLFRPVQIAYGRAQRAHKGFAERHQLPTRAFTAAGAPAPSHGVKGFVEDAVSAISEADTLLANLQDSMLPVEVGDRELRTELEGIRSLIGGLGTRARELERRLGR